MDHLHTLNRSTAHLEWVDAMDARQTAHDTDAGGREAAAAEEQRLWLLITDPRATPTERVKAYASWLRITGALREPGPAPESPKRPGSPA